MPLVFAGRNEHISWALTGSANSLSDSVVPLSVDAVLRERNEVIQVRGGVDGNETSYFVTLTVREVEMERGGVTQYLPLLSGVVQPAVHAYLRSAHLSEFALSSHALRAPSNLKFLRAVGASSGWESFLAACSSLQSVSLNALYADTQGNIGATSTGDNNSLK